MSGRLVLLVLVLLALFPTALTGQYLEPHSRSGNIVVPPETGLALERILRAAARGSVRSTGTLRIVIIPTLFRESADPHITPERLDEILFAESGRTVTTFYEEISGGQLQVEGEVTRWVRSDVPRLEAAGERNGHGWIGDPRRVRDHFRTAVRGVDDEVDFRQYDNDGPDGVPDSGDDDGQVDGTVFVNIEPSGNCGGSGFWPHIAGTGGIETADIGASGEPIRVSTYIAESAVDCGGVDPQGPGVLAHELGHLLGLPDYYAIVTGVEASQRHWTVGCFALMGGGTWGCGVGPHVNDFGPTHMSPLSKWLLGWLQLEEVSEVEDREYTLEPVQTSRRALRVPLSPGSEESFLIEYRPRLGFDDDLPGEGVLVYHLDESEGLVPRTPGPPDYRFHLVEADGDDALRLLEAAGGNRGVAEDMFGLDGVVDSLTHESVPSTAHHGGQPSTLRIRDIRIENGVARLRITTTSDLSGEPIRAPGGATALEHFEAAFRVTGGTRPYTVVEPEGAFVLDGVQMTLRNEDEVVISGRPLDSGSFSLPISTIDDAGNVWWHRHDVVVDDAALSDQELMTGLAIPASADEALLRYLDNSGDGNGTYGLGDLRAYLLRTGGL